MVESVELSRADYPELHALSDEIAWVLRRRAELQLGAANAAGR
jgi:hypothetical protein